MAVGSVWFALSPGVLGACVCHFGPDLLRTHIVADLAFEKSGRYIEVGAVTIGAVVVLACIFMLPGRRWVRPAEQWAAGRRVDRAAALQGTYVYARRATVRAVRAQLSGPPRWRSSSVRWSGRVGHGLCNEVDLGE